MNKIGHNYVAGGSMGEYKRGLLGFDEGTQYHSNSLYC